MTDHPAPLWQELLSRYDAQSSTRREAEKALVILRKEHCALYDGASNAELSDASANSLRKLLERGGTLREQRLRARFLNQGFRIGARDLNWQVSALPRDFILKSEPSPFTPKSFSRLRQIRELEDAFLRDLTAPLDEISDQRLYGQLLLSAILFGGLLHLDWVEPWLRALPMGVRVSEKCLWIEIGRRAPLGILAESGKTEKTTSVAISRRWFADPVTEALLYRALPRFGPVPGGGKDISPPRAWGYVRGYLSHLGFGQSPLLKSLRSLTVGVKVALGLRVSQALVGHACGDLKAVSLPPAAWIRLLTGKSVKFGWGGDSETLHTAPTFPSRPLGKRAKYRGRMAVQEQIIKELREALYVEAVKGQERKFRTKPGEALSALRKVVSKLESEMCPLLGLLSAWFDHLLSPSGSRGALGKRGRARQPSTVGRYVSAICGVLVATGANEEPEEMTSDDFAEMYEEAAEGKKSIDERRYALTVMVRFHSFLVEAYGLPYVTFTDIPSKGPVEASVDANLITSESFGHLIDVLGGQKKKLSRTREMALLLAILAFRCGLREREGRFLRVSDLQGRSQVELLIRRNAHFSPKSSDGTRRLPLNLLLEQEELDRLMAWRGRRFNEGALPHDPLFSASAGSPHAVSYGEGIEPVKQAMRQVTGDHSLVFHHLRHSAGNWLLVRLTLDPGSPLWQQFAFLRGPEYAEDRLKTLRRGILGSADASRSALYAVALLLGHSSPEVSLQSYLHLLDWLIWAELSDPRSAVPLTEEAVIAVTGLSRSTVWTTRKSTNQTVWAINPHLPHLRRQWVAKFADPLLDNAVEPEVTPLSEEDQERDSEAAITDWRIVQRILDACQRYPRSIPEQADTWGLTIDRIQLWISRAADISKMTTASGMPRHHGIWERNQKRHRGGAGFVSDVPFPSPPRGNADQELADRMLARYHSASPALRSTIDVGVVFFLNHFSNMKSSIRCARCCQAMRYLEFLALLAIPQAFVRVMIFPPSTFTHPDRPALIRHWASVLKVDSRQCRVVETQGRGRTGVGSVAIKVASTAEIFLPSKVAAQKRRIERYRAPDSHGFRYALYLLSITRHCDEH
ncbi:hypothetical protein [Citrifermentans bremense]|uniref:hypothetical protein n=1 Tax=Citrifermentans bremense TaxID=60035 RepID=UPI0003F7479F|nr:hypothetical protein [Citrifermentans bremense]